MSRRGEAFERPGSQPPVIDRQPRAALSWASGARHGARGLSGRIRTLTFSVVVASCGEGGGETVVRPGSHPPAIDSQPRAALSLTSGARHGARGLSGRLGTLTFSVAVASCGGCRSRRGGSFGRPGSHPPVIGWRPRAALSSSSGARIEAQGLGGGIGKRMFSVVVASLRGVVGCMSGWWSPFGRPGSQPIGWEVASIMSRPSALRVTGLA